MSAFSASKSTLSDPLNPAVKQPDVPLSLALFFAAGIGLLFFWLKAPKHTEWMVSRLIQFFELNSTTLFVISVIALLNLIGIALALKRACSGENKDPRKKISNRLVHFDLPDLKIAAAMTGVSALCSWYLAPVFVLKGAILLPFPLDLSAWNWGMRVGLALAVLELEIVTFAIVSALIEILPHMQRLPKIPRITDGIIVGAVHEGSPAEELIPSSEGNQRPKAAWVLQSLKALTGNVFITGAIGWGKSQVLLQMLKQLLCNLKHRPAMLAIDPKRTFVRELRKIIESQGKGEHIVWISLDGAVKFNPIWRENLLKKSAFTEVANSLRLASVNFLGSSSENRFWEQSSFNLLKNALVYCAAKYDYFTFKELYEALVAARDANIADELINCLSKKEWDEEEYANIGMSVKYFREEFSRMDEKVRTSILATATSFLNEFLEYRVSQILSPKKEQINIVSMKDAIRDGKLICLYIENDALARSIGTLLKLLFQEAVLEMVDERRDAPDARYALLVMDEYQDVATSGGGSGLGDDRYLAKARESKSITIVATQSVSSLENAIRSDAATRELLQNFRTKLFGASNDSKTVKHFQEPHGTFERERRSHSFSDSSRGSSAMSSSESVSTHFASEYPVTAKEFARLRSFEAYAQIFDGLNTRFEMLYLKPHFLKTIRTAHRTIMKQMEKAAKVMINKKFFFTFVLALASTLVQAGVTFPNVCSVLKATHSTSCLDFQVSGCMCGWPIPRPCARISYSIPQTFIEVWPESKDSFFLTHPAGSQLASHLASAALPFGTDDDGGSYSFQAHAIAVPLAFEMLAPLPCGGTRIEKPCFDLMSEDLGGTWKTGSADFLQPSFLAWQLSPKSCLLKGAAQGVAGGVTPSLGSDSPACSYPIGALSKFPPSSREQCNGWGMFFPRSGIYQGGSQTAAALMIGARLKNIGVEVSHTLPGDPSESWQMIYPQSSSCFKEGQNLGFLETAKGVRETERITGKLKGYLFVVWKRVTCCRDIPEAPAAWVALQAIQAACLAVPTGT